MFVRDISTIMDLFRGDGGVASCVLATRSDSPTLASKSPSESLPDGAETQPQRTVSRGDPPNTTSEGRDDARGSLGRLDRLEDPAERARFAAALLEGLCRCMQDDRLEFDRLVDRAKCRLLTLGVPASILLGQDEVDTVRLGPVVRMERFRVERCLRQLESCGPFVLETCVHGSRERAGDPCIEGKIGCHLGRCETPAGASIGACIPSEMLEPALPVCRAGNSACNYGVISG